MPLPAIALAGLPWLGSVITAAATAIFTFFLQYMSRRVAQRLVYAAALLALLTAFWAFVTSSLSGLTYVLPSQLSHAWSFVVPDNAPLCLSICYTARSARAVYDWQKKLFALPTGI
jgi:hypothetical protein